MVSDTHKIYAFQGAILLTHMAYLAIFLGIAIIDKEYLQNFSTLIQFGVCMFLIYKTFPYQKIHPFTRFDHSVIFYCATFLLMNVVAMEMYNAFVLPLYSSAIKTKKQIQQLVDTPRPHHQMV
jgi:hypothetical protein